MRTYLLTLFLFLSALASPFNVANEDTSPKLNGISNTENASIEEDKFLPVDEAFKLSQNRQGNRLVIKWEIADGYYLYQSRLKLKSGSEKVDLTPYLPQAETKQDPYFGEMQVYHHELVLNLETPSSNILEITYQGCAEAGLCYPPQKRVLDINKEQQGTYESTSDRFLNSFTDKSILYTLFIYFLVGVATAFAGCSYPMFPILSKIIVGQKDATKLKSFTLSLAYVLPIALVYAAIGVLAGTLGSNLANWFQQPIALVIISLTLFAMALSMFGLYELQMPSSIQTRLSNISHSQQGGSYLSAAIMGFISAFIVSACVVPPVVAAVSYVTKTGDVWLGAGAMFSFGLGLGSPLLLLGLSAGWLLPKAGAWMDKVQRVMGVFLLSAAIWIIDRVIPDWITFILWASLAAFVSVYLTRLFKGKIALTSSVASGLLALVLLSYSFTLQFKDSENIDYEMVDSVQELENIIANNPSQHMMLDFYADWCTACKKMEHEIFMKPEIAAQLSQFRKIKIDLSQMSQENVDLMKKYEVIGPPAFLFLTPEGKELESLRVIGELNEKEFSLVLSKVLEANSE